ncbi:hypothetical protein J1N35_005311 [Gossypium stocksii]|uniref:Aminotransferase-like plant mobile domain-containing protein n=1 Tax=Gossypium stocksii TaxID=47602 RepID=A0A9D4AJ55_9ROSI|nr:hypothetical protein J1N35_005311 [Gossypium stocksii]
MTNSLIHFDNKYIFTAQAIMADDHVLERFIHNLSKNPTIEICVYLQDVRFLHVSRMLESCKLDHTLISMLVERWRLKTHIFHLPCSKCTTTLKDIDLQLGLPVDGPVVGVSDHSR